MGVLKRLVSRDGTGREEVVHEAGEGGAQRDRVLRERGRLALAFLTGNGIEIGALHNPLPLPPEAKARYVDRMTPEELRSDYPELSGSPLVPIDILDDGERLATVRDGSQDFVVANHFLEHCQNPLLALQNMLRVLRAGGVLYLAVPDKRFTFDSERPVTPLEHVVRDYEEGPAWSKLDHYLEWVVVVAKAEGEEWQRTHAAELARREYSIHFHVWEQAGLFELLGEAKRRLGYGFDVEAFSKNGDECVFVVRKT